MRILIGVGVLVLLIVLGGAGYWFASNLFVQDPNEAIVDQFFQQNGISQSGDLLSGTLVSSGTDLSGDALSPDSFSELVDLFSGEAMSGATQQDTSATASQESQATVMSLQQLQALSKEELQQRRLQDFKAYKAGLLGSGSQQGETHSSALELESALQSNITVEEEFTIETIQE